MPGSPGIIILIALRYPFCELSVNVAFEKDPQDQNTISYDHLALRVVINRKDTYLQSKWIAKK
jgi:hypothetical protein